MLLVQVHGVLGDDRVLLRQWLQAEGFAGVGVGLEEGSAGAGDGDPDAVTLVEDLAEGADVEGDFVDLPRLHEDFLLPAVAVAGAADVVDDEDAAAVGIDVGDPDDEVGVLGGRGDVELGLDFAGPLHGLLENLRREGANLILGLELLGVGRPGEAGAGDGVGVEWVGEERDAGVG